MYNIGDDRRKRAVSMRIRGSDHLCWVSLGFTCTCVSGEGEILLWCVFETLGERVGLFTYPQTLNHPHLRHLGSRPLHKLYALTFAPALASPSLCSAL